MRTALAMIAHQRPHGQLAFSGQLLALQASVPMLLDPITLLPFAGPKDSARPETVP